MHRRALLPYFALVALAMTVMGGIFTLLGQLRDELGFSESQLGLMVGLGFFAAFGAQIGLSRYSDRGHSALMIRLGVVLLTVGTALMTTVDTFLAFTAARMVVGVGVGLILPAVRRMVVVASRDDIGANLGLLGAFDVGGFLVGPLIAGFVSQAWGLRAPFWVLLGGVVLFVPVLIRLPEDRGARSEERRVVTSLLRLRGIRAILLVGSGWFAMIGVAEAVWSLLLTDRGAEPWLIGFTLAVILLPMILLAPIFGRLAQRRGPLRVAAIGVLAGVPSALAIGYVQSLWVIIAIAFYQGFADAVTFPATQVAAGVAADEELAASAQGLQGAVLEVTAGTVAIVAGVAYERLGPETLYSILALVMFAGVLAGVSTARDLITTRDPLIVGFATADVPAGRPGRT